MLYVKRKKIIYKKCRVCFPTKPMRTAPCITAKIYNLYYYYDRIKQEVKNGTRIFNAINTYIRNNFGNVPIQLLSISNI